MPASCDVVLIGTGLAPLIAANSLIIQGKNVLLLNPDLDYFLEDSELPLDPMLPIPTLARFRAGQLNATHETLGPEFPGAIESWPLNKRPGEFHDPQAPHIHQRARLLIHSHELASKWTWESLEDLYVTLSDLGAAPQLLDGIRAARRFPGNSKNQQHLRGLLLPKLCDVDLTRYRYGLLEYIRERLDPDQVHCAADSIEKLSDSIRFSSKTRSISKTQNTKILEGIIVFWTPKMSSWILKNAKALDLKPPKPKGIRLWEHWKFKSREKIDPNTVGMFQNMLIWSDFEGPSPSESEVAILKQGPLVSETNPLAHLHSKILPQWAASESFESLSQLFFDFLSWNRLTVRSLKTRAIYEWTDSASPNPWFLETTAPYLLAVPGADGPITQVVANTKAALLKAGLSPDFSSSPNPSSSREGLL